MELCRFIELLKNENYIILFDDKNTQYFGLIILLRLLMENFVVHLTF